MEIPAKLADALLMFWQALDDQERRMLVVGCAWAVALVVSSVGANQRRERERNEIAARVLHELRGA